MTSNWEKLVGIILQRKHTTTNENHCLVGGKKMAQARTLDEKELKLLLLYIQTRKYAERDRALVAMSYYAGMRVKEIACTKIGDVLAADGSIKTELRLSSEQTKGRHSRTVVLSEKLRKELLAYLQYRFSTKQLIAVTYTDNMHKPLFNTQKSDGFTANTLCYHFHQLYKQAGLYGASSHSGRRTFLTTLSAKAVPLRVMMDLAGHRQAQTTMRYCDVTMDMKKAAVELL